jgi:dihydropteroate synthase
MGQAMATNPAGAAPDVAIMGVLNVTPDSFSDGGAFLGLPSAIEHAAAMAEAGASYIDVGGESTRPGAMDVSVQQEIDRVVPVIEAISARWPLRVSVDTSKPEVMRAAATAGAAVLNDVYALQRPGALAAAAELKLPVCLMHMQGEPRTMQQQPHYMDVVGEVEAFLLQRAQAAMDAGIARADIWLDPGFGFGKTLQHNLELLRALPRLAAHGYPLLVGLSRKSMLQALTGRSVDQRLAGSLALALLAAQGGATVLRVHDVAETMDVLNVWRALGPRLQAE